jgi:membrane-associated phospholipid phosphatase
MFKTIAVLFVTLLSFETAYALADEPRLKLGADVNKEIKLDGNYWKGYVTDTKSILGTPSHWKKAPAIISIGVLLYNYDQDIKEWAQDSKTDTSIAIADVAEKFGNGLYVLPSLGAFYLYGHLAEDTKVTRTALLSLESFVVAGMFVQAIKVTGGRHRPNTNDKYNTWDGPSSSLDNLSFPSGHSQTAFSIATVIATEYSASNIVPPIAYGIATLAALSRVHDNAHWASDAFVGSAIGYLTAKAITSLHTTKQKSNTTVIPMTDGKNSSISVIHTF